MHDIIKLLSRISGQITLDEPMYKHTTFKIGGPADVFVQPRDDEELAFVVQTCKEAGVPCFILGNGSNLLVKDDGIRGVVVSTVNLSNLRLLGDNKILAGAGVLLSSLSKFAYASNLAGLEFAEGIPGSVGGAVVMNAGAYGGEISQIFHTATIFNSNFQLIELSSADMAFSYRKSTAQKAGHVVMSAIFQLSPGDAKKIAAKMAECKESRTSKQPLNLPSAGSTFKRPPGKFAGKLIMDCGLRGYAVGRACVSEKHCGFVVNNGGATASDVLAVMEHVEYTVQKKFGIRLEPEVKIVGE